jgi:hypothetical protein
MATGSKGLTVCNKKLSDAYAIIQIEKCAVFAMHYHRRITCALAIGIAVISLGCLLLVALLPVVRDQHKLLATPFIRRRILPWPNSVIHTVRSPSVVLKDTFEKEVVKEDATENDDVGYNLRRCQCNNGSSTSHCRRVACADVCMQYIFVLSKWPAFFSQLFSTLLSAA